MNRGVTRAMRLEQSRLLHWPDVIRGALLGLFVVQCALVGASLLLAQPLFGNERWPEAVLLVLAGAATVGSLARRLPAQNVIAVALLIAILSGAIQTLGATTGVPFGPFHYTDHIGQKLFGRLPWALPVAWLVVLLNSREVARLLLRPWRGSPNYGLWLLAITILLVVAFDLGLEPFAANVKGYWVWPAASFLCDWYGAPGVNFLGWAAGAGLILVLTTPFLISKQPVPERCDCQGLVVWLLLNALFATASAAHRLWAACGVTTTLGLLVAFAAGLSSRTMRATGQRVLAGDVSGLPPQV